MSRLRVYTPICWNLHEAVAHSMSIGQIICMGSIAFWETFCNFLLKTPCLYGVSPRSSENASSLRARQKHSWTLLNTSKLEAIFGLTPFFQMHYWMGCTHFMHLQTPIHNIGTIALELLTLTTHSKSVENKFGRLLYSSLLEMWLQPQIQCLKLNLISLLMILLNMPLLFLVKMVKYQVQENILVLIVLSHLNEQCRIQSLFQVHLMLIC